MKENTNSNENNSDRMYSYRDEDKKSNIEQPDAVKRSQGENNPNNPKVDQGSNKPPTSSNSEPDMDGDTVIIRIDQSPPLYWMFFIMFGLIQVILLILIAFYYNWEDYYTNTKNINNNTKNSLDDPLDDKTSITGYDVYKRIDNKYKHFQEVNIIIFLGFGLLRSFLKHYSWTSIILTLIGGILSLELSLFMLLCWSAILRVDWSYGKFNFQHLLDANFCSGAVIISLGAVMGKLSIPQYLVFIICETICSSLNYTLLRQIMKIIDVGGTLTLHLFGAIYGGIFSLVSYVTKNEKDRIRQSRHLGANYKSINFAIFGSLLLITFWPSLNTCLINDDDNSDIDMKRAKYMGIINTYLSILGSIIGTFCVSPLFNHGKFRIEDILNSCFSGGIVVGGCCHIINHYWLSILIGFLTGSVTTCLYNLLGDRFLDLGYHDTANIFYYHGIPGFFGGIITTIFVGNLVNFLPDNERKKSYIYKYIGTFLNYYDNMGKDFTGNIHIGKYAGVHFGALWVTIAIAAACGFMAGFSIKFCNCNIALRYFNDWEFFDVSDIQPFPWKNERVKIKLEYKPNN